MKTQVINCLRILACVALAPAILSATPGVAQTVTVDLAAPPATLDVSPLPVETKLAFPNLRVERPIVVTGAGDGSGRLFIASQQGKIYFVNQSDTSVNEATLFLDIEKSVSYKDRENEEGLLGLAFHPQFKTNGKFYVYYSTSDRPHVSIISQFTTLGDDHSNGDVGSEVQLMEIQQPFWNHNGGTLVFGPDGFLYVALGDGGKGNDPLGSGQDLSKLLGSILRIDVDHPSDGKNYGIPADNPLVGRKNVWPEIYAWGVRNIWRMAFDPKTGDLWAADVGQNQYEEINLIRRGGNYGWSLREGQHSFTAGGGKGSGPRADLIEPIAEYPHTDDWGKSIMGGAVYRGPKTPELDGYYLYGDYVTGKLWGLMRGGDGKVSANRPIKWSGLPIMTFGQGDDGEVYMTTHNGGGRIYRFVD